MLNYLEYDKTVNKIYIQTHLNHISSHDLFHETLHILTMDKNLNFTGFESKGFHMLNEGFTELLAFSLYPENKEWISYVDEMF